MSEPGKIGWLEETALEVIEELHDARYVSFHAGYGDYELPGIIIELLTDFLKRAGIEVPPAAEEPDEDDEP